MKNPPISRGIQSDILNRIISRISWIYQNTVVLQPVYLAESGLVLYHDNEQHSPAADK